MFLELCKLIEAHCLLRVKHMHKGPTFISVTKRGIDYVINEVKLEQIIFPLFFLFFRSTRYTWTDCICSGGNNPCEIEIRRTLSEKSELW